MQRLYDVKPVVQVKFLFKFVLFTQFAKKCVDSPTNKALVIKCAQYSMRVNHYDFVALDSMWRIFRRVNVS